MLCWLACKTETCITQALLGHITDIATLVAYSTAEESNKLSQAGTITSLQKSNYSKQKSAMQTSSAKGASTVEQHTLGIHPLTGPRNARPTKMTVATVARLVTLQNIARKTRNLLRRLKR